MMILSFLMFAIWSSPLSISLKQAKQIQVLAVVSLFLFSLNACWIFERFKLLSFASTSLTYLITALLQANSLAKKPRMEAF